MACSLHACPPFRNYGEYCTHTASQTVKSTQLEECWNRDGITNLLQVNLLCKFPPPKRQCFFKGETNALQKEAILEPPKVSEVVVLAQGFMEVSHAGREGLH